MNRFTTLKLSDKTSRFRWFCSLSIFALFFIFSNSSLSAQQCSLDIVCVKDTVFCGDSITMLYQDDTYRRPEVTVLGNCGSGAIQYSLVAHRTWKSNECPDGVVDTIFRKWTISIPNKVDTFCTDTFLVNEIPVDELVFPEDTTIACELYTGTLPTPESSGMPYAIDDNGDTTYFALGNHCNVMIAKTDEDWGGVCDGSRVLRRYWLVKDFCDNIEIRDTQTIMVIDTIGPEFADTNLPLDSIEISGEYCVGPLYTYSVSSHGGCEASGNLPNLSVTDACGSVSNVLVTVRGAFMNMKLNNGAAFSGLPVGKYCAEYVAIDDCGNQDTAYVIIKVEDHVAPVLACDDNMNISITGDLTWYNLGDLENLVQENCGLYKVLGRRRDYSTACNAQDTTSEVAMHYAKYQMWALEDGDQLCTELFEYGFTEDVPFCCSDINKNVRIDIMAIDSSCNVSTCSIIFTGVDGVDAQVQSVLRDVDISCDTWYDYYNEGILGDMVITNVDQEINCVNVDTTTTSEQIYTTDFSVDPTTEGWYVEENDCGNGSITWVNNTIVTDQTTTGPYCEARIDINLDITDFETVEFNTALSQNPAAHYEAQDFAEISYSIDGGNTFISLIKDIEVWTAEDGITDADNDAIVGNPADITDVVDGNGTPTRYNSPVLNVAGNSGTLIVQYKFFNLNGVIEQYRIHDFQMTGKKTVTTTNPGVNCDSDRLLDSLFGTYQFDPGDGSPVECHTYWDITECDPASPNYLAEETVEICNGTYIDNCSANLTTTNYIRRDGCGLILTRVFETGDGELARQIITIENKCPLNEADFVFDDPDTIYTWNYSGANFPTNLPKYDFDTPKPTLSRSLGCDNLLVNCTDKYFDPMDGDATYCGLIQRVWMITTECAKSVMVMDTQCIKVYCNGTSSSNLLTVQGTVKNHDGRKIHNVAIQKEMDGSVTSLQTDANGNFVTDIPGDAIVSFEAVKEGNEDDKSISVLDILTIQRHILNKAEITDPHKLIAADVNMDGRVSGKDIVYLRRYLLQKLTEAEKHKTWRFLDADYTFKTNNPITERLPEKIKIVNGSSNKISIKGIKLGDLDQSVNLNRYSERLDLVYTYTTGQDLDRIAIKTNRDVVIEGLQTELRFDSDAFSIKSIKSGSIEVNEDSYNVVGDRILINTIESENLAKGNVLFTIELSPRTNNVSKSDISVSNKYLASQVITNEGPKALDILPELSSKLTLVGNFPNPFRHTTDIVFESANPEQVMLNVFDLTGRLIISQTMDAEAGTNRFKLEGETLTPGVYVYEVQNNSDSLRDKMVVID